MRLKSWQKVDVHCLDLQSLVVLGICADLIQLSLLVKRNSPS